MVIIRNGNKFCVSIPGNGEESLRAAMELRDELVREARPIRKNAIPRQVLQALGLSQPVIGVSRLASRSSYRVFWTDETGKHRLKAFYYRVIPEVDAYAAAVAFKEELDREKFLRRSRHGGATRWDESRGPLSLLGAR